MSSKITSFTINKLIDDELLEQLKKIHVKHVNVVFKNGDRYRGGWLNNLPHGEGIMNYNDGDKYDGEWYNGAHHGEGKMIYENGDVLSATYINGFIQHGHKTYANGSVYIGEFDAHGKPNGDGVLECPDFKYTGQWKDGKKHGTGAMVYKSGEIFEGEFMNDVRMLYGKLTTIGGDVYIGSFAKNGNKSGFGLLFNYRNWYVHKGIFKNNIAKGKGVRCYINNDLIGETDHSFNTLKEKFMKRYKSGKYRIKIGDWCDRECVAEQEHIPDEQFHN